MPTLAMSVPMGRLREERRKASYRSSCSSVIRDTFSLQRTSRSSSGSRDQAFARGAEGKSCKASSRMQHPTPWRSRALDFGQHAGQQRGHSRIKSVALFPCERILVHIAVCC